MLFNSLEQVIQQRMMEQNMVRQSIAQFFAEPYKLSFGHLPSNNPNIPWVELVRFASSAQNTLNYNNSSTDDDIVNYALQKKAKLCSVWGDETVESTKRILCDFMRGHGIYNNVNAIKFLRDIENEWLLICDACGNENLPQWEECRKCESINTKI